MRPHPAHTAARAIALTSILAGGLLAAAPAGAAPSDEPNCTVRAQHLEVTVDRKERRATTTADWDVHCRKPAQVTAELRVTGPNLIQAPLAGDYGTRFRNHATVTAPVDPDDPAQTAVLTFREGFQVIGHPLRKCAKRPDGREACYRGGKDGSADLTAREVLGFLGLLR
ncbi:hypothetical protein ACH429_00160 [Streptomyces pathocidini]|uniref:Uncharacterized protein n=1 Tax=Streptomyces pathocidini TaxID=1650571 RepID=A0ABW7UMC8_9ACTN|nr:hypothetical protein [Streptomyces pathocidini]